MEPSGKVVPWPTTSPGTPPLPADAPLLSLLDVGAYLRRSVGAVRKILDRRSDGDDGDLREVLQRNVVKLSKRRTYIAREPFLAYLREQVAASLPESQN